VLLRKTPSGILPVDTENVLWMFAHGKWTDDTGAGFQGLNHTWRTKVIGDMEI